MLENLPVLLLKKLVLLPYQEVRLELNIELSKKIIDVSIDSYNSKLLVICPNNTLEINPTAQDLPSIGVIAKIKSKIELPNGNYRVIISGINRVLVSVYKNIEDNVDILEAKVKRTYIDTSNKMEEAAILRTLKSVIESYMEQNPQASNSVINTISNITDLDMLTDIITNFMPFDIAKKVAYMNEFDYVVRANNLIKDINLELQVINIETKIDDEIREKFDKEQRDYILKQKISKLNEELGINVDKQTEIAIFNNKIDELIVDEKTKNKFREEVKKYSYTSESNPDSSVIRNYLETALNLPWNVESTDERDLKKIKSSLDKEHFGLTEAKQRIIEYIAIKNNNANINAPIICLIGPPGVGKTTLGISISKALNREFCKIGVGGLNDATELTGHKRTYLGSSPGKIIQSIKKCGTKNPVILIDEVDKIVSDFKGDPSAVLLDILDQNQNKEFMDNYIEEPFDLSKVLFILTANDISLIPPALKDRLEIIQLSSYTEFEKIDIAKKHILPKIYNEYNLKKIKISDSDLLYIINYYTAESGVRDLTRVLEKLCRNIVISEKEIKSITKKFITDVLGPVKFDFNINREIHPGSVSTLGVTPYGGIVISIETLFTSGEGNIIMTGNVKEPVLESVKVACSYIKANYKKFKIKNDILSTNDIHINALKYSIKKDGTSGGIAFTTSILSAALNKEIDSKTCFTGEITLHGDIYKVGGVKEKIIGAYNNGFKIVYIPKENENDLETIPEEIKKDIKIKCVSNYSEIYKDLFVNKE
ncbi:MAG: endopeptidase La [Erysipelotrichales bacterium]|nr:endopeptidase La [Erysipelotrichales bacterium]